jgi:hypothetical protein
MIPGPVGRLTEATLASAATINYVKTDVIRITGTTQIDTIIPPFGGQTWSIRVTLIPVDGAIVLSAAGNVLVGITMAINRSVDLIWSKTSQKWYIESGV